MPSFLLYPKTREIATGFDRENLYFEVARVKDKLTALKRYLDLYSGGSGIVYCSTRKSVDELYRELAKIVENNNGLWCAEAEKYLLANAKAI